MKHGHIETDNSCNTFTVCKASERFYLRGVNFHSMLASAHSLILKLGWGSFAQLFSERWECYSRRTVVFKLLSLLQKQKKLTKEKFQGSPSPLPFLWEILTNRQIYQKQLCTQIKSPCVTCLKPHYRCLIFCTTATPHCSGRKTAVRKLHSRRQFKREKEKPIK